METLTVTEAAKRLNLEGPDVVYRLLRLGRLKGEKVGKVWRIDAVSIEERRRRIALKRSSKVNAEAERERRREAARAAFAE